MSLFGFHQELPTRYRPSAERIERLSVASWLHGLEDATPVFGGDPTAPSTVIIRWETDARGYLLGDAPAGEVLLWQLSRPLFDALASLHQDFHLGRHDVWLHAGRRPSPCPDSLQRLPGELKLRGRLDVAMRELAALRP